MEQRREKCRLEQQLKAELGRSFAMIRHEFGRRDAAFDQLRSTVLDHHRLNLELLLREQEELKNQILHLQQGRWIDGAKWGGIARETRIPRGFPRHASCSSPSRGRHEGWD